MDSQHDSTRSSAPQPHAGVDVPGIGSPVQSADVQAAVESDEARFAFGKNWLSFLSQVDEERISQAVDSLREKLDVASLEGRRFFDLGSGSGIFSLAAHRLGAEVVSIDFDAQSVACTREIRDRFGSGDPAWKIQQGSILDTKLLESLGEADVAYSWGVVHHTGKMTAAIQNVANVVSDEGYLFLAIYNDQGGASRRWLRIKRIYHALPKALRPMWVVLIAGVYELRFSVARAVRLQNPLPFADWRAKNRDRGMSAWHDWVDWVGGLPFEVAAPEAIIVPLRRQGFLLTNLKTVRGGWGCNEYVFQRRDAVADSR